MRTTMLLIALLCFPMLQATEDANWSEAKSLFTSGDFQKAKVYFEEAVRARPSWFAPYMMQGRCHMKLGEYEQALVQFQEALALDDVPDQNKAAIQYYMGHAYMGLKHWHNAAQVFGDLAPRAPASRKPGLYINIASCRMAQAKDGLNQGDMGKALDFFQKSIENFDEAMKLNHKNREEIREAAFQRGWATMKMSLLKKDPALLEDGVSALEAYLARDNQARNVHKILIDMDFQMIKQKYKPARNNRIALKHLDAFLSNWPDDARMVHFKGQAHHGLKQFDKAIPALKRAVTLAPKEAKYHLSLGKALIESKQFKEAYGAMEQAQKMGLDSDPDIYNFMVYCLSEQKTGCFVQDIPLIERAVGVLKAAKGKVSGKGADLVTQNLSIQENNLNVLKGNIATDNSNHQATLENIRKLSRNIDGNTIKLQRDTEKALTTNTEELQANIKNLRALITADKKDLAREYLQIEQYLIDAGKCGGAKVFKYIPELKAVLAAKP